MEDKPEVEHKPEVVPEPNSEIESKPIPIPEPKPIRRPSFEGAPPSIPAQVQNPPSETIVPQVRPGEGIVTGSEYASAISNLMEMGFEKSEVERALTAAFGNPERATDYLLNVI